MEKLELKTSTKGKWLRKSLALWAGMLMAASPAWAAGKITISGNGQLLLNDGGSITLDGVLSLSTSPNKSVLLVSGTILEAESGKLTGLGPLNVGSNPTYNLALAEEVYPPVTVADNGGGTSDTTTDTDTDTTTDTDTDTTTDTDTDTTTDTDTDTDTDTTTDTDTVVAVGTEITEGAEVSLGGGATVVVSGGKATITVGDSVIQLDVPTGAKVETAAGGAVVAKLELSDGKKAEQTANQDGTKVSSFTTADGKTTKFTSPPGSTTAFEPDGSSKSTATIGGTTQEIAIDADGKMKVGVGNGEGATTASLPPGTAALAKASGAATMAVPMITADGPVTVDTGINKSGEAIIKVPSIGNAKPVVMPKTKPPATVTMSGSIINIITALPGTDASARSTASQHNGNFVGRTNAKEVLIYPGDNATFAFERDLASAAGETEVTLDSGSASIDYGGQSGTMNDLTAYSVSNDAIELSLVNKSNYVSIPANVSLSDADLEIDFDGVHSVWIYNNSTGKWGAYSADSGITTKLSDSSIAAISGGIQEGSGMFVYSAGDQEITIGDGRDFSIKDALSAGGTPASGWHLLSVGNQGDSVGEIVSLSANISAVWVSSGSSWGVYSSDPDTQKAITNEGFTLLESSYKMPSTSAIWVHVVDSGSSQSSRVATPPSN